MRGFILAFSLSLASFFFLIQYSADGQELPPYNFSPAKTTESISSVPIKYSTIELDGISYSKQAIIWDFLRIAFSDTLWLENTASPWTIVEAVEQNNKDDRHTSDLLKELMQYPKGYPVLGGVNKWADKKIVVGLGWPKSMSAMLSREAPEDVSVDTKARLEKILKPLLTNISGQTGISIEFVSPDDPREQGDKFARMRIVPVIDTGLRNNFKSYIVDTSPSRHRPLYPLGNLVGGVEFTPYSRSQVDGFFLPDQNNNISFSACRLKASLDETLVTALLTECIVRSLGLPKLSKGNERSFLSAWNKANDPYSLTIYHEGTDALDTEDNRHEPLPEAPEPLVVLKPEILEAVRLRKLTDYDAKMLSMLYCRNIKEGMGKLTVLNVLLSGSDSCL